jgi:hypothetical protein
MDLSSLMFVDIHCRKPCALCARKHHAPPYSGGYCQQRKSMNINENQWLAQRD